MLTTLLTSFGSPLLVGGDELGNTQGGNNNAYCQDSEISWIDWANADAELIAFTRRAIALRGRHPVLRRRRFLAGVEADEIEWFTPGGEAMTSQNWDDANARCVAVYLDGSDDPDRDDDGLPLIDDDLMLLVNGWSEPIDFVIAPTRPGANWTVELDSADSVGERAPGDKIGPTSVVPVGGRSVVVLSSPPPLDLSPGANS